MAIVGYMGSGKTTLGRLLARAMNSELVDLDHAIEQRAAKTIPEIFAEHGEQTFRALEHDALLEALHSETPCLVACGGGVVLRQDNRTLLRDATTIFLREDTNVLYRRTRGSGRPLRAASREEFEARYAERLPLYREVADFEVQVDGRQPSLVTEEVLGCLSRR